MIKRMNKDRAYDFLCADGIKKIVFAYKFHHPRLRTILEKFVDVVIEKAQ